MRPHPDRLTGNIFDLKLDAAQFDIVYSFQVFEHLPEPAPVFNKLLRLTKSGGYHVIHTDMEPPERKEGFQQWWYVLPPDHCSFFKIKSFKRIVEDSQKYVILQKDGKQ